jgi:hypothetical protein
VVDHYDEEWTKLWWVRVDGLAEVLTDGADRAVAIDALREKYRQYRERVPDGPVVRLVAQRFAGWSAV